MKRAILHIGMHKTGSTAIQQALGDLDDRNTRFVRLGKSPNHSGALRSLFARDFTEDQDFFFARKRGATSAAPKELVEQFTDELTHPAETLIFSGEMLSLFNAAQAHALVARIRDAGRAVQVIGYARDPVSFAGSWFQQVVHNRGEARAYFEMPGYQARFEPWIKAAGPDAVTLRRYDTTGFPGGSVVGDFAQTCALTTPALVTPGGNPSFSAEAIYILWRMNRLFPAALRDQTLSQARRTLVQQFRREARAAGRSRRFQADLAMIPRTDALEADVAWLASESGTDFSEALNRLDPNVTAPKPAAFEASLLACAGEDRVRHTLDAALDRMRAQTRQNASLDQKITQLLQGPAPKRQGLASTLTRVTRRAQRALGLAKVRRGRG